MREEVVADVHRRGEGVDRVVDLVLDGALLLLEGRLELVQVRAARWLGQGGGRARQGSDRVVAGCERTGRELGLHARLEARLGLGHELRAHIVPRRVVGRRDRDRGVREVADLDLREKWGP